MFFKGPIPTDNLYKFLAIFGLVIIGITLVNLTFLADDLESLVTALASLDSLDRLTSNKFFRDALGTEGLNNPIPFTIFTKFTVLIGKAVINLIFLTIGTVSSASGFGLWFFRRQILEDQLLMSDLELKVNDVKRSDAEFQIFALEAKIRDWELSKRMEELGIETDNAEASEEDDS